MFPLEYFIKLKAFVLIKAGLIFGYFFEQPKELGHVEFRPCCDVGIRLLQELFKSINQVLNGFLTDVVGIYPGEEVVAYEEEQKDEISSYLVDVVAYFHLIFQSRVL